jgi:hypothetical protein
MERAERLVAERNLEGNDDDNDDKDADAADIIELALMGAVVSDIKEPQTYLQAINSKDSTKWKQAMSDEFTSMRIRGVWKRISSADRKSSRILQAKWVYKVKNDGRYRARLVVKGYNQIPGVDFTESHSPVACDTTIRLILILCLLSNWHNEQIDVETAFLYGELTERIMLQKPEGFDDLSGTFLNSDEVLLLDKAMYGLVQAARAWINTYCKHLVDALNFKRSMADPCLLIQKSHLGTVITTVYVDDCIFIGDKDAVDQALADISKKFNIKRMGPVKNYVGATYKKCKDGYLVSQHDLVDSIISKFGIVKWKSIPAAPSLLFKDDGDKLDEEGVQFYRSGVGKLLYLVKLSRPDLATSVRELSKFMDGATDIHLKAMQRVMEFVSATKQHQLTIFPKFKERHNIQGFSDSNFASDKDTRRSVTGFAIFYAGTLVSWKSKAQQCVTLSTTEAEYVAASQCANEMEFVRLVLQSVGETVNLPMKLRVDNTGAIDLMKNWSTNGRSKHIDVRFHYLRELVEQGMLQVDFVKSEDNTADIFTKNLASELFGKHSKGLGMQANNVAVASSRDAHKEGVRICDWKDTRDERVILQMSKGFGLIGGN